MARTNSTVTDAQILAYLEANDGNTSKTAKDLKVGKGRVHALNKTRNPSHRTRDPERKRTVFEAAEGAVLHLAEVLETLTKRDGAENAKGCAIAFGIAVDKLLLIAGKPISIQQNQSGPTPVLDLSALSREDLLTMLALHDKANKITPPVLVNDLSTPVVYDDESPECVAPPVHAGSDAGGGTRPEEA